MKIFAVENDEAYIRIFQEFCKKHGWELYIASNYVDALFLFAEERPFDYYNINLYFPYDHESNAADYLGPCLIRLIRKYEMNPSIMATSACMFNEDIERDFKNLNAPMMSTEAWYELLKKGL